MSKADFTCSEYTRESTWPFFTLCPCFTGISTSVPAYGAVTVVVPAASALPTYEACTWVVSASMVATLTVTGSEWTGFTRWPQEASARTERMRRILFISPDCRDR